MEEKNIRILIVDDSSTMRRIIRMILKRLDYSNVEEVSEGQDAVNKLKDSPFQLVVCGGNMPGMTGLDLLKAVREDGDLSELPFMLVTSEATEKFVKDAIDAGVNNLIVKPFTEEVFSRKLQDIFENQADKRSEP